MVVRGAPLIGATAAYGVALAMASDPSDANLDEAVRAIGATRPTAVNLHWALDRMERCLRARPTGERAAFALAEAGRIAEEDVECCRAIGEHGAAIVREIEQSSGRTVEATRTVDPDLIGGLILQAGSLRVDASVRGRLNRLRRELVTRT